MKRMLVFVVVLVGIAIALPMSSSADTTDGTYGLTQDQFNYDTTTGSVELSAGEADTADSASSAEAAAFTSGAVEVVPSLSLDQATGVQSLTPTQRLRFANANGVSVLTIAATASCRYGTRSWEWGYWPGEQDVYDHTHRCWNGSVVTYRATTVTQGDTLCHSDGTRTWKSAGGVGSGFVRWDDQGNFDCPFPLTGGLLLDPSHQRTIIMEATAGGGYWIWSAS